LIKNPLRRLPDYKNGWTGGQYSLFRFLLGIYLFVHFLQLVPWGAELWSDAGVLPNGSIIPFMHIFPNMFSLCDRPLFITAVLIVSTGLSLLLALGWYPPFKFTWLSAFSANASGWRKSLCDGTLACLRIAINPAFALWYIWACLYGRNPFISNPGLPYVGLLLIIQAVLPPKPFGSLAHRGETDPGTTWRLPQSLFGVMWVLMSCGYTYSGYEKLVSPSWVNGSAMERVLANPLARTSALVNWAQHLPQPVLHLWTWYSLVLELTFLPLALSRHARPFIWLAAFSMHHGIMLMINFIDLSLGMVMLHLFTFNPIWINGLRARAADRVYFDGSCGLCHGIVRFLLSEDRPGDTFLYAPLNSDSFRTRVPEERRLGLPDSVVVLTADERLLVKSDAVLYLLRRLGGVWRLLGIAGRIAPHAARDFAYDIVASLRKQLFAAPAEVCPLIPKALHARFED
jgi:predicted DCC family thiol-disulfide oxidoreductase YuxK